MSNSINVINPIQSVSQVIEKLFTFPGIGPKTTDLVIEAVVAGKNVVEIIENPVELAGVAKNRVHVFKKFLEAYPLPKKLRRIKNIRVIVAQADLDTIGDDLVSKRNYSDFGLVGEDKISGYKEVSGSYAFEMLAPFHDSTPQMVTTKKMIDGQIVTREVYAYVLPHVFFIDLNGDAEGDLEKKQAIIKQGMKYIDHEGVERTVLYAFRSPSQERQVQVVGTAAHIVHPVDALNAVGMNPFGFAKVAGVDEEGKTIYKIDYVKAMKRFGLTLSNSVKFNFIRFGTDVIRHENGDITISGGNVSVRVVEDTYSVVKQGLFKAFGKETKKGRIFDAADHNVTQVAGDGEFFMNSRVHKMINQESGRPTQNGIGRLFNGAIKGNGVHIYNLDKYFTEDIVIPMSAFKSSPDTLEDILDSLTLQYRVALFGTPSKFKKQYVNLPYQFVHGMKLSAETMIKLVQPHLDRVKDMLKDPELIKQYLGLEKLMMMEDLSIEEQEEALESTLVSTLTTFLHYSPQSYNDIYLKEKALVLLQELIKQWKSGSIPVEANYRFLVMDPYAILEAYKSRGTKHEIRKDGKLYVNPDKGLKAGTVFMVDKDSTSIYTGKLALARNPQMTKGQSRVVKAVAPQNYVEAAAKGCFDGMVILSCHDFNAIAQGGADFDGDTSMCMTQPELIEAVERACKSAPAFLDIHYVENKDGSFTFGDGCPFPGTADMSKYTFKFTKEQYDRQFELNMYHTTLEYVAETLKPNRIGELTDFATKIADAVRVLNYKFMEFYNAGNEAAAKQTLQRTNQLEEMIDLLAWVQSWEIDRAKHGGAYEEALKEELSFIENPPVEVSYTDQKTGKQLWFTPDWMAFRKGKTVNGFSVQQTNSVLSLVHQHIVKWEEEVLVGEVKAMRADVAGNNLLSFLSSAVELPESNVVKMGLISSVRRIKTNYNLALKAAYEKHSADLSAMEYVSFDNETTKEKKEMELKRMLDDALNFAVEKAQAELMALSDSYEPAHIGLVAYQLTYSVSPSNRGADVNNPARGLSFPWTAGKHQLLAAVRVASNNTASVVVKPKVKQFDDLEINKVNIGLFTPGFDGLNIANLISEWNNTVAVKVEQDQDGNMMHHVYVKKQRVASIFPEYITHFTGTTKFVAQVKDLQVKGKSITFNLASVTRY